MNRTASDLLTIETYVRTARTMIEIMDHPIGSPEEKACRNLTWAVQAIVALRRDMVL